MVQRCYDNERRGACAFRTDFKVRKKEEGEEQIRGEGRNITLMQKNFDSFSCTHTLTNLQQDVLAEVGIHPPDCVTNWCCNFFIVHKSRVLRHPKSHYHTLLDFVVRERTGEAQWKHG